MSNPQTTTHMKKNNKGLMYGLVIMAMLATSGTAFAQRGGGNHHYKNHGHDGKNVSARNDSKRTFSSRIYRVTEADSLQQIKMKPAVEKASKRLDNLRLSYQKQEKRVMDSLSLQLKPILKEEQMKRLDDFNYHRQERIKK